ncbi:MAG: IS200/IS605 family transposase [Bacteroidales bacterium]
MPHSIAKNYVHIIFSTKNRYPFIDDNIRERLFNYIGGICKNLDCQPLKVGGYKDHVHILCLLSQKIALTKLITEIKSFSSMWVKDQGSEYTKFYWQTGYGCFSVNPTQVDIVINYISNQVEHHKVKSFQDEHLAFLHKYKIKCDEKYLWD